MNRNSNPATKSGHISASIRPSRGLLFGFLILAALLAFEIFNYSTTDFALSDLLGNLRFADLRWSTILAIAFCGIDFAGIARLFTPEKGAGEPREVWYLFGAWMLAATMNAILTWWGVAIAILSHTSLGGSMISPETLVKVVPVFVAIMVWVIRVLIIGSFSMSGGRLFSQSAASQGDHQAVRGGGSIQPGAPSAARTTQSASFNPVPKAESSSAKAGNGRAEPTYHRVSMSGTNSSPSLTRK